MRIDDLKMPALKINQLFGSLRDFKESLRIWALTEHFDYRWAFSDSVRAKAVCAYNECPFTVRCNWYSEKDFARITVLVSNHNCIGNPPVERSLASRLDWLLGVLPTVMKVDATTTTHSIIDAIALHYGYRIHLR